MNADHPNTHLQDNFQRSISYLRLSITDRCDFRCVYCMAEEMTFLPRKEVLSLEEFVKVSEAFVDLGVEKIRITGGEPLVRRDVLHLVKELRKIPKLKTLCMTTNGASLERMAQPLVDAGLQRLNISLDTLQIDRFTQLTRVGQLDKVLRGIDAALKAGFESVKINSVLMRDFNLDETEALADFSLSRGMDISFIEEMPLGQINSHSREQQFVSSEEVRELLSHKFQLQTSTKRTGGPSRYWQVTGHDAQIGFISPHSQNFCSSCNRVRVTASGKLLLCLGNEHSVDLKKVLREENKTDEALHLALKKSICDAMQIKPEKHEFDLHNEPQILRFMNATGG